MVELKDRINSWPGFGEVDINDLVTRLAKLERRVNEYEENRKDSYCDRDVRMDSDVGMQGHGRVDTGVTMDTSFRMSNGVAMDSGVGKTPNLNILEDASMDDLSLYVSLDVTTRLLRDMSALCQFEFDTRLLHAISALCLLGFDYMNFVRRVSFMSA
ncbi:hypothetical protein Tco_0987191 [Tanacetum coccineum]